MVQLVWNHCHIRSHWISQKSMCYSKRWMHLRICAKPPGWKPGQTLMDRISYLLGTVTLDVILLHTSYFAKEKCLMQNLFQKTILFNFLETKRTMPYNSFKIITLISNCSTTWSMAFTEHMTAHTQTCIHYSFRYNLNENQYIHLCGITDLESYTVWVYINIYKIYKMTVKPSTIQSNNCNIWVGWGEFLWN